MQDKDIARFVTTDTPYELVNEPFRPEFLNKYKWNRGAVQLAFEPASTPGDYPHWQMILDHVGKDFDEPVANDLWCQDNGIHTGADLIKLWDARVIRAPKERLIGLSLISTHQNCGKSIQFSKFQILMTKGGYVLAEKALTTNFTWPLLGALLCDLDDVDLSQKDGAIYQKLQPLMTNDTMVIEGKGTNVIQVHNCTHWGHTANRPECCPVQDGDTRFIIAEVGPIENEIPRMTMDRCLIAEAPYYLRALFDLPMPKEAANRLYLPVLDTPIKRRLMAARAQGELTADQTAWLKKIQALADAGKLNQLTPFPKLAKLMGKDAPPNAESLTHVWARLSVVLEQRGYKTANRRNSGGKYPAAWAVYQRSFKTEEAA